MSDEEQDDDWSWQMHVNTHFPGLIVIATVVLITMIAVAYLWVD